jgi:hypothetical protein
VPEQLHFLQKKTRVVEQGVFANLLAFLSGVLEIAVNLCGEFVVSLWWIA